MRIYNNVQEAMGEIKRDLAEMGITYQSTTVQDMYVADNPDFLTKELMPYSYTLTHWNENMFRDAFYEMGVPYQWIQSEHNERTNLSLENKNPGAAWLCRPDLWTPFMRDGAFSYTYPERMHPQMQRVIYELSMRATTRQAIMTVYDTHMDLMNWGGRDRVPCSIDYHFMIRNNAIHIIYDQRSCDYKQFLVSDMYFACNLLAFIVEQVNMMRNHPYNVGTMIHNIHSLHAFAKDLKEVF